MINTPLDDLLSSSPTLALAPPWGELEQIDDTVARVAERLQTAPWLLPRLLPSLTILARKRSARWRSWLEAGEACSVAELKSRFSPPSPEHLHTEQPAVMPADDLPPAEPLHLSAPVELIEPFLTQDPLPDDGQSYQDEAGELAASLETSLNAPEGEVSPEPSEALAIHPEDLVSATVGQEQIKAFAQHFGKRRFSSSLVHERDPRICQREDLVRHILERLGTLPDKLDTRQAGAWKDRLEELTDERRLQQWLVLDKPLQVDLLTLMVALTRAVQEAGGPLHEPRKVFARLSAYSQREQPGFTHGMARQHKPAHGSWLEDAVQAQGALQRWLGEGTAASSKRSTTPPTPPVAVAPAPVLAVNEEPEEDPGLDALVEEGWPCWPHVRARRAVLVGGVPKERCRQRLAEAFQFASLDWVDGDVRRVDSVTSRIQHRGLDLVLVVRDFISHKASRKLTHACKNHKIPCVLVEHGHGVLAVRRSLERSLSTTS